MEIEVSLQTINGRGVPAVTSLQIAEAFGKEHRNVLRDVKDVVSKCSETFSALNFELAEFRDAQDKPRPMYLLSKDGFVMLAMGYTGEKAMALKEAYIARFNEMDAQLRGILPDVPDFSNPAVAARAWAEQYERRQIAEAQRDDAIRTKAQIGSRREATCMVRTKHAYEERDRERREKLIYENENEDLRNYIGDSKTFKTVKAQTPRLRRYFQLERTGNGFRSFLGKKLKAVSLAMSLPFKDVPDATYGSVKAFHVSAWDRFFELCEHDPEYLSSRCPRRGDPMSGIIEFPEQ